jgi:hypothetical protein
MPGGSARDLTADSDILILKRGHLSSEKGEKGRRQIWRRDLGLKDILRSEVTGSPRRH